MQQLNIRALTFTLTILITMLTVNGSASSDDAYLQEREVIVFREKSTFFGHAINLTSKENMADEILMTKKVEELTAAYENTSSFLPSLHFFEAKSRIDESEVFKFIRKIPKGASLHTHWLAAVSADFVINNITYRDKLYGGYINNRFKLKFMESAEQDQRCNWTLISQMRNESTAKIFDPWLKGLFTVDKVYPTLEGVWDKFKSIFSTVFEMLSYKPVFEAYVYQLLQELYEDNVLYTELKGAIMPLYELDGTTYTKQQFFEITINVVNKFKSEHPEFVGVRYIFTVYRGVHYDILQTSLEEIIEMKKLFPDFIAGFDFVGFEEEGKSILDYRTQLLEAQKHLKFFFHAGETNWFGHTDTNLIDAILLNSSRIGHGFAITKHPSLLQLGKERNIPLEVCPISNQVLMLNADPRNHPAATLMALDYPIIVGNDDPSAWNATGLSYDWYIVFMAMTPKTAGLKVLKQLALNSIVYSAMDQSEKDTFLEKWEQQWNVFLDEINKEKPSEINGGT